MSPPCKDKSGSSLWTSRGSANFHSSTHSLSRCGWARRTRDGIHSMHTEHAKAGSALTICCTSSSELEGLKGAVGDDRHGIDAPSLSKVKAEPLGGAAEAKLVWLAVLVDAADERGPIKLRLTDFD
eukprot:scaffold262236_cov31-Tisochrysis_lutea.AAC.1